MEGYTPHWTDWINIDRDFETQPCGYDDHQGDQAAEIGLNQPSEPLLFNNIWHLDDPTAQSQAGHPLVGWPSSSMSLSEQTTGPETFPHGYINHGNLLNGRVPENVQGRQTPIVQKGLARHEEVGSDCTLPSTTDTVLKCSCMICVSLGSLEGTGWPIHGVPCRYPACQQIGLPRGRHTTNHERAHFGQVGDYHCLEEGCKTTTKKWADLKRHYLVRHCTNATRFPCPSFGCKYGGNNGFTREDKLKSHHRNVHQGKAAPGKALQPLKPKMDGAKVTKAKPQGIRTLQPKTSAGA